MRSIVYAGLLSFFAALACGPATIRLLRRLRAGQQVRSAGPQSHAVKSGTPTMGGLIIVAGVTLTTLLFAEPRSPVAVYLLIATLGFALIGLLDDFIIVVAKRSLGLRARYKLLGEALLGALVALYALNAENLGPSLIVPFTGELLKAPPVLFVLIAMGTVVGSANAVNITDGLDGLAAGAAAIAGAVYSLIALQMGQMDAAVFAAALAGASLGFSWFNTHPAQVFMGDTGSLALGGALGTLAVLTRTELVLVIIGGLFVVETLSVVLQVGYFRLTKGKRIFKMSPLHHHFELTGWAEPQIVTRFWLVALLLGLIGLLSLP